MGGRRSLCRGLGRGCLSWRGEVGLGFVLMII
jgi:hypothetical protein